MIFVLVAGLVISPILTWAFDLGDWLWILSWAITGFSFLMLVTDNDISGTLKLAFAIVSGGGCAGTIIMVTVWLIGMLFWGLDFEKHGWYIGIPSYIICALLGTAAVYGLIEQDEEKERAQKQAQKDLSEINRRFAGETREERIRRITERVKEERRLRDRGCD